jgi:hypothetical protein
MRHNCNLSESSLAVESQATNAPYPDSFHAFSIDFLERNLPGFHPRRIVLFGDIIHATMANERRICYSEEDSRFAKQMSSTRKRKTMAQDQNLKVEVHYIAAKKPFETEAKPSETVGQLKTQALKAFGLVEEGNKTFKLFYHKTELQNLGETLGQVAGDKKDLNLDLEEFIIQGK